MATCTIVGCSNRAVSYGLCSTHRARCGRYGLPLLDITLVKFWRQVERSPGCWLWQGCTNEQGYGVFGCRPQYMAHRYAYEQLVGPITAGLTLDHECHNADRDCMGGVGCIHRRCCNPAHLTQVGRPENTSKGKRSRRYCKRGHEYDFPGNSTINVRGDRVCLVCIRERG